MRFSVIDFAHIASPRQHNLKMKWFLNLWSSPCNYISTLTHLDFFNNIISVKLHVVPLINTKTTMVQKEIIFTVGTERNSIKLFFWAKKWGEHSVEITRIKKWFDNNFVFSFRCWWVRKIHNCEADENYPRNGIFTRRMWTISTGRVQQHNTKFNGNNTSDGSTSNWFCWSE